MTDHYEREAARLASMTRAERFEELLEFPVAHEFKVIGATDGLSNRVEVALADLGHAGIVFIERASAKGRYLSLTFKIRVASGRELDELYCVLEALPELRYVF